LLVRPPKPLGTDDASCNGKQIVECSAERLDFPFSHTPLPPEKGNGKPPS